MLPFSFFRNKNESIGRQGERVAEEYLQRKGFHLLERNYRNPVGRQLGEIDLIMRLEDEIVFVEVKSRRGVPGSVFPEDNLTPGKLRKLERIASQYLRSHRLEATRYRFDAIAIIFDTNQKASVRHFESIFC